jgi:DNA-binding CsgD family transcriptional regulator
MNSWITALYVLSLISFLVPVLFAAYLGVRFQAPLAFNFVKFNLVYGTFLGMLFAAFELLDVFPSSQLPIELFFDTAFFIVYAGLLLFTARVLFEMVQRPWAGVPRRVTEILAVAGVFVPLVIHALVFDGEETVKVLRFCLNGVYVFLFLAWLLVLFFQAALRLKTLGDPWKKTTLAGACLIVFGGVPLYLIDIFWPWFQVEWKLIPRGFNVHIFFVLAWNTFFTIRWLTFPVTDHRVEGNHEPPSERMGQFTAREREIVLLILQGKSNHEIGSILNVRPGTTKNHIYNIFNKTGASSRKELSSMLLGAS